MTDVKCKIIAVVPVYNAERWILQTLESIARQTVKPGWLIVLDNCSTDGTAEVVKQFKGFPCEYIRNEKNLGLFGNCNKALEFAENTQYLHLCCADDLVEPKFYETLMRELADCNGLGLAFSLDERIDENNKRLSMSGTVSNRPTVIPVDKFIEKKAEIANQAFSGSLMKTSFQKPPVQFRLDMPILADVAFWAAWGAHCKKIVRVNLPLCKYRWHGDNTTNVVAPGIQPLILDEWKVMQLNEALRAGKPGLVRRFKMKGLFAVRTGIKAKRIRQQNNLTYSREITIEGKKISGGLAWFLGQCVVEFRDLVIYGILRRPKHPKNVYS